MSNNIILRPARRSDISILAHMANSGNAKSALHRRMAPWQDQNPIDYHHWRLNIIHQRFATPNLRTIVAEDTTTGELLGQASWAVEGEDTQLHKEWTSESTWAMWLEDKLLWIDKTWRRYFTNRSIDHRFLDRSFAGCFGDEGAQRPACLHCHMIVVDPDVQSRGVGRMLIDWGKELAVKEELPLFLEATLEAVGFYKKGGFSRLSNDLVVSPEGQEPIYIPVFVWEGEQREGRWLERDNELIGTGERWKWRDDVLLK